MNRQTRVPTKDRLKESLARRYRSERRFALYGFLNILFCFLFLGIFFVGIFRMGWNAFFETRIRLSIYLDPELVMSYNVKDSDFNAILSTSLQKSFPDAKTRQEKRELAKLVAPGAEETIKDLVMKHPEAVGSTVELWLPGLFLKRRPFNRDL